MNPLHLAWDKSDIENIYNCIACGSEQLLPLYQNIQDLEEGVAGSWMIDRCTKCQSLYLNPRPTLAAINRAYPTYYTHVEPTIENEVLNSRSIAARIANSYLTKRYGIPQREIACATILARAIWPLRQQLDYFMRLLPRKKGRLLDVGCGSGGFLYRAKLAGWEVEGVEPDPNAARVAKNADLGIIHASMAHIDTQPFDVITLCHVIEHVHRPDIILEECFNSLNPQGRIWIATPNIKGYGHRRYGKYWQALEVPRHLVMPSPKALQIMLKNAGFESIEFKCRGRGSAKRFAANEQRAGKRAKNRSRHYISLLVDIFASFSPNAGEDLIVTALKPK